MCNFNKEIIKRFEEELVNSNRDEYDSDPEQIADEIFHGLGRIGHDEYYFPDEMSSYEIMGELIKMPPEEQKEFLNSRTVMELSDMNERFGLTVECEDGKPGNIYIDKDAIKEFCEKLISLSENDAA